MRWRSGVAAWMRYVTGIDEKGNAIDVRDPLRDELRAKADAAGRDAAKLAPALLAVEQIFGARPARQCQHSPPP